jgi:DNA-binding transcriptional regulator GbsR (MarR family)
MDDPQSLDNARRHYIEAFGNVAARNALPAIAGRIAAILYLTPAPVSFSALERELGVSRASISTNTRLLEYLGTIVRIKIKGQRENFFASSPNVNVRTIERELARARESLDQIRKASAGLEPYAQTFPPAVKAQMRGIERLFQGRCDHLVRYRDELTAEANRGPI